MDWFSVKMLYDQEKDAAFGIVQKNSQLDNDMNQSMRIVETFLDAIPMPIFFLSDQNEVLLANHSYVSEYNNIHYLIETYLKTETFLTDEFEFISHFERFESSSNADVFLVSYHLSNISYNYFVIRETHTINEQSGILYVYQPVRTGRLENVRLRKILKANELIIEIRDIVDHADDINEVFHYLLSKIHTVIPDADRSCILRLDDQNRLFLDSSYGFHDEYVKEFKLPFDQSYAYMHMGKDYTKSVIINDIQKRYSDLFPDLKDEHLGFKIESNVTTPIIIDDELYGIVSVDSDENKVFDDVDLNLLDFIKLQLERAIEKFRRYTSIKKDSKVDSLTGAPNRRHLLEVLSQTSERADKQGKTFCFVIFDLDKLKAINDNYGHISGDRLLQYFSFVIQNSIRGGDFFARIGGDEFVGLFYDIDENILIQRILDLAKHFKNNPINYKENQIYANFSFGIAKYPNEGKYFSSLLELADERMYQQKRNKE
jgi:diguanylate cyclase (GGDEF)-like protein